MGCRQKSIAIQYAPFLLDFDNIFLTQAVFQEFTNNSPSSSAPVQRATAPETVTKRQRQNKAKREAEKSAKLDAEAERRKTLEKHQKDLEKTRIDEQWRNRGKTNDSVASVSEKGSLVWS